ncbi:uncharacterized protein N7515_008809 [Penicillium bovifimosum]|uniref:Uncharacterized protein n=1 Tax=Penicillium bovifimosum TaxID=126998 RepID=A0A9W9GNY9_9EURO|nr:uncharacterized protein N7515_008809 [Penicillium bovifimosum]KAJ5124984.1 hypothetical protein N7515_008809 [Penicillium bovifimosum]
MFGGSQAADRKDWRRKSADEQLQTTKTMGMVFEYINHPDVWEKFCATYEAIYNRLGEFDEYHSRKGNSFPVLQDEWPKYIDVVLKSMANRSRGTLSWMFQQRAEKKNKFYSLIWGINVGKNVRKITLPGKCPNLPRS